MLNGQQHLPGLFLLINVLFLLLGFPSETFPYCVFGLWYSWVYLRFYQRKAEGVVGDRNETFSFASFFPDPLQYVANDKFADHCRKPVGIVSTIIWTTCKLCCRCCIPSPSGSSSEDTAATPDDPDTERRR